MPNADVAWIDVLPSAKNFLPNLRAATEPAAKSAGESAGRTFGSSFGSSSTNSVEAASAKMAAALRKTEDAAGAVRVAEERLKAARESTRATQVQIVTAEEGLAKARRNETAANEALATTTRNVSRAQEQHNTAVSAGGVALDETNKRAGFLNRTFSSMQGIVATGFGAFYAASGAISLIGGTIKAASDLNETVNKASTIFGSNMAVIDAWAKGAARNLGLSRSAALETAAGFGNMFSQLGFTADESARLSIKVTQMAADLGSFNNLPTADVADRIAGAFRGEYDSLQQLIPNISDARVKSEAMAMTGVTNADALTAQQKAAAVLSIVTKDGAAAMGDFSRTSGGLANSQKILSAEFDNMRGRLGALLIGPATAMVQWVTDMIPRLESFSVWLRDNANWLLPLAGGVTAVAVALKAMSIAQAAVNIAMEANPIIRVIGLLLLLGSAVVAAYQSSETFRNVVDTAFHVVGDAAVWLWEHAIQPTYAAITAGSSGLSAFLAPVFSFIADRWRSAVDAMAWAWDNVLHPAWVVIAAVASWLWDNILSHVFSAIQIGWSIMVALMADVWNNVLHPMFDLVGAVVNLLYSAILYPIFSLIGIAWTVLLNGMEAAWSFILHPMFVLLGNVLQALWTGVLSPTFSLIGAAWEALMRVMKWLYDTIVHPMFQLFGDTLRGLKSVFEVTAQGIRVVWDAIMDIVSTPVNFIIGVVFNKGLFTAWNWIVDHLGLSANWHAPTWSQLPRGVHFAEGGGVDLSGGGRVSGFSPHSKSDNIDAKVTAGEFVEPVESRRFYGVDALEAVRRRKARILYADGGLIPHFAGGGITWPQLDAIRKQLFPGSVLTSALRPGAADYHGLGEAIDIGWPGNAQSGLMPIAARLAQLYPQSTELIHNPNGSIKNGAPVPPSFWGAATWAAHANHVHWAMTPAALLGGASAAVAGAPVDVPWYMDMWGSVQGAFKWFSDSIKDVGSMVSRFGGNDFVRMIAELPPKAMNAMWGKVEGSITNLFNSFVAGVATPGSPGNAGDIKSAFSAIMQNRGWQIGTPQWPGVDYVISHESGWNPTAQNPVSTASGLGQFIDSTWRAYRPIGSSAAHMKEATVAQQAQAFGAYVAARYGTPLGAMAYWQAHHNYALGGPVVLDSGGLWRAGTMGLNLSDGDERVWTAPQDDYFRRFVDVAETMFGAGAPAAVHVYIGDEEITNLIDVRLDYRSAADGLNVRSSAR